MTGVWSARVRTPELGLVDPVKFSSATLVRNYNAPSMLSISGRLDNIRAAALPGYGIVVHDDTGTQQFSGVATSIQRNGDGTGSLIFTGDLVRLWWRTCWPTPSSSWESQTVAADVQTASVETRILGYIQRNAGSSAYHSTTTGTDPGGSATASFLVALTPTIRDKYPQAVAVDPEGTDFYITQASDNATSVDDLRISRINSAGVYQDSMTLPKGGHGIALTIRRVDGKPYCVINYGGKGALGSGGQWVQIPYVKSKVWTSTQALAYKVPAPIPYKAGAATTPVAPYSTLPATAAWFQGQTFYDGKFYRVYGSPDTGGTPEVTGRLETITNNTVTSTVDISSLGDDGSGNPLGGRKELQGLATIMRDGQPCLLIGVCVGTKAALDLTLRLYTYPIAPTTVSKVDRRFPHLRLPTSLARGDTGTSSARFHTLGNFVAKLAESADLSLDIVQTYTGTAPYLDVVVNEAPDLTDSVRIGTASGGGPIMLGTDWTYKLDIHVATTILSGAGGVLTSRILTALTDQDREDLWGYRIEQFINQTDVTDTTEIQAGMRAALDEAVGPTEISVPLGHSALGFGTDVPLGSRISAVLDGELITERIRQITTEIKKADGEPTVKTTAVLGSPDAGIQSPTQRELAKMLRRVQRLERN